METFNGAEKLRKFSKQLDAPIVKEVKTEVIKPVEQEVTKLVEDQGFGNWAVYKRSVKFKNARLFMSLSYDEARRISTELNDKEKKRREDERNQLIERGLEYIPDDPVLFDFVEQGTDQESRYYNPRPFVLPEN